jgi:hypothetical protein
METSMSWTMPLPSRFLSTMALASVMAALLSYQFGQMTGPRTVPVAAASPEMMQLLRDEHGLVATMLATRLATEKQELTARGRAGAAAAAPRTFAR